MDLCCSVHLDACRQWVVCQLCDRLCKTSAISHTLQVKQAPQVQRKGVLPRVPSIAREIAMKKKSLIEGRSDFHRHPPRSSARRQDLENRGTDHRHSLYSHRNEPVTATFAGRARVKKGPHCWEPRRYFINPGGICGSFREHKRRQLL